MKLIVVSAALLASINAATGAAVAAFSSSSFPSGTAPTTRCYTSLVVSAVSHPTTSWSTVFTPCATTITRFFTTTQTLPAFDTVLTATIFITATAPATTDTYTSTITSTSVTTTVTTELVNSTTTDTVFTIATSNVPIPDGFVPVDQSLPGAGSKRRKRAPIDDASSNITVTLQPLGTTAPSKTAAGNVRCYAYTGIDCFVHSFRTTQTITALRLTSTAIVLTETTVSTTPTASTTVFTTSTTTSTQTSTAFTTATFNTTITSVTATTTLYDACAPSNIAQHVNGVPMYGGNYNPSLNPFAHSEAHNALECCIAAIEDPLAALWLFQFDPPACGVLVNPLLGCVESSDTENTLLVGSGFANPLVAAGNAVCGQWVNVASP